MRTSSTVHHASWSAGLALLALLGCCACGCKGGLDELGEAVDNTREASVPLDPALRTQSEPATAAPETVCSAGRSTCTGLTKVQRCNASGTAVTTEDCAKGAVCAAGRCADLGTPTEGLLRLGGQGWVNAWAATDKIPRKVQRDPALAPGTSSADLTPLCGPGPYLPVIQASKKRRKKPAYAIARTTVYAPEAQEVWLKAGAKGVVRAFVNGQAVLGGRYDSWRPPLIDAWVRRVQLSKGPNEVVVWLEQENKTDAGIQIRLHKDDHHAAGVFVRPPVPCPVPDLVTTSSRLTPRKGGFDVRIHTDFMGLRPAAMGQLPYRVTVNAATEAAVGALSPGQAQPIKFTAKLPSAGPYTFDIDLGTAGTHRIETRFHGALHDRIVALASGHHGSPSPGIPQGSLDSAEHDAEVLMAALSSGEPDATWLARRTDTAEEIARARAGGQDRYSTLHGVVHRAYRSPMDNQLQPYTMFVPEYYGPSSDELPLVIAFHGLNNIPDHALRAVVGKPRQRGQSRLEAGRYLPKIPDQGVLIAAPWGYGDNGQRLLGEADVLAVVRDVKRHYRVDPSRITITGYSLGGTVAMTVPLHYPDLFAYAVPLCGYPNLYSYREVRKVKNRKPWEKLLLEKRYIVNYAENGRSLPMWLIHGGKDQPKRSQLLADAYSDFGYKHIFDVQEELGHNVWDYAYEDARMITHLKRQRRRVPPTVVFTTGEYRYNRSHWVKVDGIEDNARFGRVKARWDRNKERVTVQTDNLSALTLDLGALGAAGGVQIVVDGTKLAPRPGATAAYLEKSSTWQIVSAPSARNGHKRAGVSGPLDDIQLRPTLVVYGTQVPAETETNRLVADWHAGVNPRTDISFPVKADHEVTAQELKNHSLILVGRPETNVITQRVSGKLPFSFSPADVSVRGVRHQGADIGISMIQPSPFNDDQYVVVHAGVDFRGTLASRNLPEMSPDYLVYRAPRMTVQVGQTLLDKREVLDGGFFDDQWR